MKQVLLALLSVMIALPAAICQGYVSYFTGNEADLEVSPFGGVCLMGGAGESDEAMSWFLEQANGGDILVLRASGSDGYNDYLHSELGVNVNSVETLVFSSADAAYLPEVHERIANAEGIWFAGGDQWDYVSFWRDTPVAEWINEGIVERNIVVGGISAGMAVLGEYYFSAENGTVTSTAALNNPYNAAVTVDSAQFFEVPFLERVITDTHYNNPNRKGRHVAFLARALSDFGHSVGGIACDEYTAVCVDGDGVARVFGEYPDYEDTAYFIAPNCELLDASPELCAPGSALNWDHSGQALKVYEAKGTPGGDQSFDLNTWQSGVGGSWKHWSVIDGDFQETEGMAPSCGMHLPSMARSTAIAFPNPATSHVHIPCGPEVLAAEIEVFNASGQPVEVALKHEEDGVVLNCSGLASGMYHVVWANGSKRSRFSLIR